MKNKILAISTLTLLLAGQSAIAGGDTDEDFLRWLDGSEQVSVQVDQPNQFDKVSIRNDDNVDSNYKAEEDIFSIHFMSDK